MMLLAHLLNQKDKHPGPDVLSKINKNINN